MFLFFFSKLLWLSKELRCLNQCDVKPALNAQTRESIGDTPPSLLLCILLPPGENEGVIIQLRLLDVTV